MRKKLREAKFFLRFLPDRPKAVSLESEELDYYLSAFLSAGRSVIGFFMEKPNKQYRPWFHEWRMGLTADDRKLLNNMTRQRDAEVHEGGADVLAEIEFVPMTKIDWGIRAHPAYYPSWSGPPGARPPEVGVKFFYFEIGGRKVEVTATCRCYVVLLEKLVRDFESAFPRE